MLKVILVATGFAFAGVAALAQHGAHNSAHSPYAGLAANEIKALSPDQLAALRLGRGMGLALAAELNGYPGPMHVLELGDKLQLTVDQRAKVEAMFQDMKAEAVAVGADIIERERALDALFAQKTASEEQVATMTQALGVLHGKLRATHLKYHLLTKALLQPEQVDLYIRARGYSTSSSERSHPPRNH